VYQFSSLKNEFQKPKKLKNHYKIPLYPPFSKGEANISSLWQMVRHAHHPEPVEGGRQGGIFKALKYYHISYLSRIIHCMFCIKNFF
jgi:hypothetical protein